MDDDAGINWTGEPTGGPTEDPLVDPVITCVDCGGRAHLISYPPNERDWAPGDVLVYRCEDCMDRWDIVVPDEHEPEE